MPNAPLRYIALTVLTTLCGCVSRLSPEIGMTERQWLSRTMIADVAYMEGNIRAYRSGGSYFYFKDSILVKIDQGIIPAQRIEMEIKTSTPARDPSADLYTGITKLDDLRKRGLLTEDEFVTQKKRLLEQNK